MHWLRALIGHRRRPVDPSWYRRNGRIVTCVRSGEVIAARVLGRNGRYVVSGTPRALDCTCPASQLACPHTRAVAEEFQENPGRFADLAALVGGLPRDAMARALLARPGHVLDAVERGDLSALASGL